LKFQREITILVQTEDHAECNHAHVHVTYVVSNASWTPKYDIRVFGNDEEMIINYYGIIRQSTGEDWNDTKLSLSTAQPSIGGNIPKLNTLNVNLEEKFVPVFKAESMVHLTRAQGFGYSGASAPNFRGEIQHLTANVETANVGSTTTFVIPRNATIPSDNNVISSHFFRYKQIKTLKVFFNFQKT
jgi:uncharacterized protein (TIGR02231 family)